MIPKTTAARILQSAFARPWAIDKPSLVGVLEQLRLRSKAIGRMSALEIEAAVEAYNTQPLGKLIGAVAVIPVRGVLTQRADFYSWYFGGTSVDRLTASFRQYLNDPAVSTIVFDVDSPGGEVYGIPEFFEEIVAARGQKTLVAVSNPFMASAAYWIGCACEQVSLMPSGQAGSVGVYTMHVDESKWLERIGINVTLIQYGANKTEGNPYEPLSDEAREEFQAGVDFYGRLFDAAVAKGRGVSASDVKARFGQGRMFRAPDAKKAGLVDRIETLDQVLARFAPKRGRGIAATARTQASPAPLAAAESVAPNEDGTCPDGYEKGDDGQCHMPESEQATADAAAQQQADRDAIAVTLAMTEGL